MLCKTKYKAFKLPNPSVISLRVLIQFITRLLAVAMNSRLVFLFFAMSLNIWGEATQTKIYKSKSTTMT
jgi:hypothetical protein